MQIFSDLAQVYDLIYSKKPYRKEAEFVYRWAKKPKTIIELGCGTGQHAKYLCKDAIVFGIDGSEEMLKRAHKAPNIYYYKEKIGKNLFMFPNVDCVLAMFNVVGYVLLEDCLPYLPLKKGGYFIFDCWDATKFDKDPPRLTMIEFKGGYRVAVSQRISKRLIKVNYHIIIGETATVETHLVEGYYHDDIAQLCERFGYKVDGIKTTNNWTMWYRLQKL